MSLLTTTAKTNKFPSNAYLTNNGDDETKPTEEKPVEKPAEGSTNS